MQKKNTLNEGINSGGVLKVVHFKLYSTVQQYIQYCKCNSMVISITLGLCINHQSSHLLRSFSQSLLHVLRIKTDFGRRAFSSADAQICNHNYYTYCYQSLTIT